MTDDYTPTMAQVRDAALSYTYVIYSEAEFDRWLNGELAKAWEEGAQQGYDDALNDVEEFTNPYRKETA